MALFPEAEGRSSLFLQPSHGRRRVIAPFSRIQEEEGFDLVFGYWCVSLEGNESLLVLILFTFLVTDVLAAGPFQGTGFKVSIDEFQDGLLGSLARLIGKMVRITCMGVVACENMVNWVRI